MKKIFIISLFIAFLVLGLTLANASFAAKPTCNSLPATRCDSTPCSSSEDDITAETAGCSSSNFCCISDNIIPACEFASGVCKPSCDTTSGESEKTTGTPGCQILNSDATSKCCVAETTTPTTLGTSPAPASYPLPNPLESIVGSAQGEEAIAIIIGAIIKTLLGIIGAVALLMFVYGGILWLTSSGTPEKIQSGKNVILWATVGLVIILTSYISVNFIITALTGVSAPAAPTQPTIPTQPPQTIPPPPPPPKIDYQVCTYNPADFENACNDTATMIVTAAACANETEPLCTIPALPYDPSTRPQHTVEIIENVRTCLLRSSGKCCCVRMPR